MQPHIGYFLHTSFVWRAPPAGWVKLNFDGIVKGQIAGYGSLLRDHLGSIIWTYYRRLHSCEGDEGKLWTLKMRVSKLDPSFPRLIIEGDSANEIF
ncbi:hypothetical protein AMTRI_Chr04g244880 [Amborella trichopoda]